jgi:DNA-binding MarR family transcriptional regulator
MLEAIIGLIGRQVFPPEQLKAIIMRGKRTPNKYVKAYNLCDASHGVTDIAQDIDVSIGTLSPILSDWRDMGIIFEVERPGGKFYKKLYKLEEIGDELKEHAPEEMPQPTAVAQAVETDEAVKTSNEKA